MPELEAQYCPNCEAPLEIPPGATSVKCEYCGVETAVRGATDPRQAIVDAVSQLVAEKGAGVHVEESPAIHIEGAPAVQVAESQLVQGASPSPPLPSRAAPRAMSIWIPIGAVLGLALLVTGIVVVAHHVHQGPLQWERSSAPVVADLNGDGVDDLIGFVTNRGDGHHRVYAAAFSGRDFRELWRLGPFGRVGSADELRLAVVGRALAVADDSRVLHVYDLATRKHGFALTLSDNVERLCAAPDGKRLWVGVADKHNVLVDLAAGRGRPAARPSWCPTVASADLCGGSSSLYWERGLAHASCRMPQRAHRDGVVLSYVLSDGKLRVGIGAKNPGTAAPMAVGLSDDGSITWKRVMPHGKDATRTSALNLADIVHGTLIAQYSVGNRLGRERLVAIDASTGAVRWDVAVPHAKHSVMAADVMTISEHRIYLPHSDWLDIFDLATGRHLKSIGEF